MNKASGPLGWWYRTLIEFGDILGVYSTARFGASVGNECVRILALALRLGSARIGPNLASEG